MSDDYAICECGKKTIFDDFAERGLTSGRCPFCGRVLVRTTTKSKIFVVIADDRTIEACYYDEQLARDHARLVGDCRVEILPAVRDTLPDRLHDEAE